MLSNLTAQEMPPRDINDLTMDQISTYMKTQFDLNTPWFEKGFVSGARWNEGPTNLFESWHIEFIKLQLHDILHQLKIH